MMTWTVTRNTYVAAVLAAMDVEVKACKVRDAKTGLEVVEWHVGEVSVDRSKTEGLPYLKVHARLMLRAWGHGKQMCGVMTEKVAAGWRGAHPFRMGMTAMMNRRALMDAMKGAGVVSVQRCPDVWELQVGAGAPVWPAGLAEARTGDVDMAVAMITAGCPLLRIEGEEGRRRFVLGRLTMQGPLGPGGLDAGAVMLEMRDGKYLPAKRYETMGMAYFSCYCLRSLRQVMEGDRGFILVKHRTPWLKGAAFDAGSGGDVLGHVQRTLGVRI